MGEEAHGSEQVLVRSGKVAAAAAALTSLKLSLQSRSSSTSFIMFFRPRWVCGCPSFSIISFSSIMSM